MIRWLIGKRISAAERRLGVRADYLRHILRVSPRAFLKFVKIMPLAQYRRALPAEPYHVVRWWRCATKIAARACRSKSTSPGTTECRRM